MDRVEHKGLRASLVWAKAEPPGSLKTWNIFLKVLLLLHSDTDPQPQPPPSSKFHKFAEAQTAAFFWTVQIQYCQPPSKEYGSKREAVMTVNADLSTWTTSKMLERNPELSIITVCCRHPKLALDFSELLVVAVSFITCFLQQCYTVFTTNFLLYSPKSVISATNALPQLPPRMECCRWMQL